jgi:MFS family permease
VLHFGGSRSLGPQFRRLWAAYAISTLGTFLAFDAFALIAILVLHEGPTAVSLLAAAGLAVGAVVAVPLGPWVEFRRKRPVMVAMDLTRFVAIMTIPAAFAFGRLTFAQLLIVSVIVGAADITFTAASGANLKTLVPAADLLTANGRFESTTWTATMLGPPLGGAAIGLLGPVTTVVANAISFLLSALGIRSIGGEESQPPPKASSGLRAGDLLDGWRYILRNPALRPLFFNTVLVAGLIMATAPLLAVLMLGRLGFAPWQYGLAFAAPCIGGLIGSRLSRRLVTRFGRHKILLTAGTLRACWSLALAFIRPGIAGLLIVIIAEFGLITCMGVFNPVFATYRLEATPTERITRTLSAWSVTSKLTIAGLTACWGALASVTSLRTAIAIAGVLMLATPLLLPRPSEASGDDGHRQHPGEIRRPARIGTTRTQHSPSRSARSPWRATHTPAEVGDAAVRLGVVTPVAGGHDVFPDVGAAAAARDHVIERGGGGAAIDATVTIPHEHALAGERDLSPVGHSYETREADHRRDGQHNAGPV